MDGDGPQCQVCLRTPEGKRSFFCPTCARNLLYEPRIQHAETLISKEALGKEIEELVASAETQANQKQPGLDRGSINCLSIENIKTEAARTQTRTTAISAELTELRAQIEKLRGDVSKRRNNLTHRAKSLKFKKQMLAGDDDRLMAPVQKDISKIQNGWDRVHKRNTEARIFLCKEVADLYGLQQLKKQKGAPGRDLYLIGGVPIIDLRDLNNAQPDRVTTSISRVAHLLHLTSHYLGLRLPAEISLATASQPYFHIHTPLSSYRTNSSTDLRTPTSGASGPRLRILQLDRPLHQLAAEEPINYSLFIDAITLLAWNVAWVAKTQGIDVGAKHWEEICALGRNMWNLFGGHPRPPVSQAVNVTKHSKDASPPALTPPSAGTSKSPLAQPLILSPISGQYSHASSHSFLPSSGPDGGAELMRGWRFANPVRIIDRIKSALLNERTGAEWEVLEKPESEPDDDEAAMDGQNVEALESVKEEAVASEAEKPSSGWTKLRSPSSDFKP